MLISWSNHLHDHHHSKPDISMFSSLSSQLACHHLNKWCEINRKGNKKYTAHLTHTTVNIYIKKQQVKTTPSQIRNLSEIIHRHWFSHLYRLQLTFTQKNQKVSLHNMWIMNILFWYAILRLFLIKWKFVLAIIVGSFLFSYFPCGEIQTVIL